MKVSEVYLFTNRTCLIFDESGQQIADLQSTIGWKPLPGYDDELVHNTLRQLIQDQPKIYIAHWLDWKHEITLDEFACLIGFGPWYWEERANITHKNY